MDAYLAIVSKRELRTYAEQPIDDDAVRRILEAGRVAGSSKNRQQRRFVVVGDPAPVAQAVYAPDNVLGAALVIAVVVGGKGPTAFDAGRAAQNMMLAASDAQIGSCPNGIADAAALGSLLGLDEGESVATVLTFGYPVTARDPARRSPEEWIARADRKPYEEIVQEI